MYTYTKKCNGNQMYSLKHRNIANLFASTMMILNGNRFFTFLRKIETPSLLIFGKK
jgi:hypothetical protein